LVAGQGEVLAEEKANSFGFGSARLGGPFAAYQKIASDCKEMRYEKF
jgi:hypothetical protein